MNKKFLAVSLASFLALGSVSVFASQSVQTSEHSGYAIEDNNKDGLEYEQVGGGDWWHGFSFGFVVSQYQHEHRQHASSVKAGDGYTRSAAAGQWQNPGQLSDARRAASPFDTNEAHWETN